MKKILFILFLCSCFVNMDAQVYGWFLNIDPSQNADTANIGIVYPTGNGDSTGRVHYVSFEHFAALIEEYISGSDTDWLRYRTGASPSNTDTIYHEGMVILGENADQTGLEVAWSGDINISGRIDARYPDGTKSNIAIGANSLFNLSAGLENVAIGEGALGGINTESRNTAVGYSAAANGTGSQNTVIGNSAWLSSNGSNNVVIGYNAGISVAGSGNVIIGKEAGYELSESNTLVIDNSTTSTPLIKGDFSANTVTIGGTITASNLSGTNTGDQDISGKLNISDTSAMLSGYVQTSGNETIAGVKTFSSDPIVPDEAYGAGWNGSNEPPTKNAVYDKIETLGGGGSAATDYDRYYLWNDFISHVNADVVGRDMFASNNGSGSGTTTGTTSGRRNVVGVAQVSTGTATTGRACVISSNFMTTFGGGEWIQETGIDSIPVLSDATNRYSFGTGFIDNNTTNNHTDGAWFLYDEGGVMSGSAASANWQCVSAASGSRTYTTSSIAVTTGYQKLTIEVNAAGTEVNFYVNGALAATHLSGSGHFIPTTLHTETFGIGWVLLKSAGNVNRTVNIDYFMAQCDYTTPK